MVTSTHWLVDHRTELSTKMYPFGKSHECRLPGNRPLVSAQDDVVTSVGYLNAVSDYPRESGPQPIGMRSRGG